MRFDYIFDLRTSVHSVVTLIYTTKYDWKLLRWNWKQGLTNRLEYCNGWNSEKFDPTKYTNQCAHTQQWK